MSSFHPLTCCDRECAAANGCGAEGGETCSVCGRYYCPVSEGDGEGHCSRDCAAEAETEEEKEDEEQ